MLSINMLIKADLLGSIVQCLIIERASTSIRSCTLNSLLWTCPNPDFDKQEHRWKRVQRSLIESTEDMFSLYGKVFLQTDIEAVSLRMKQQSLIMAMGSLPLITKKNDSWKTILELSQIENNTFWDVGLQCTD
ncbi:hypothetical protein Tco_0747439 [Tanacetum coccineum]|uniref:Uncharacterized protein n=1 Tax=Tanacetum coccineum TaxID=301880 RepID=A0ABQ4YVS5_9ASTR